MFRFASCLCRMNFYGRNSMGYSDVISLSRRSRFALSSVCVCSFVIFGFLLVGGPFIGGFSPPAGILMFTAPTYCCDQWQGKGNNGLRPLESILWDLKHQQVEKR